MFVSLLVIAGQSRGAESVPAIAVEAQPLAANVGRVVEAMEYLGAALPPQVQADLTRAARESDATRLQAIIDARVLFVVRVDEGARTSVSRGPAAAALQQAGYTPVLVKVVNPGGTLAPLRIGSPQAGLVFAGMTQLAAERQQQPHLREDENKERRTDRFLDLEMFTAPPLASNLSGLAVEYAIALVYSTVSGKCDATLRFHLGTQLPEPHVRGELALPFDVKPAIAVKLRVRDHDGTPAMGRFQFSDKLGHVYPPQSKRLAPDLFFQKHIYRADGETMLLPPGEFTMWYGRGPEYRWLKRSVTVRAGAEIDVQLERWVNPADHGFYSGDLHLHAAGCAHYTSPTEGVAPSDMLRQVKGEGLNVGGVLTWAWGFDEQSKFFSPTSDPASEPLCVIKYDVEVSGFGSQALGHLCLLNLREQVYPGANGNKDWPSWTLPVLRWTRAQGGYAGHPHSAGGLRINAPSSARRVTARLDRDGDGLIDRTEAADGLLPEAFETIDVTRDGRLNAAEIVASHERVADELPNFAVPEMAGVGAQEIFVSSALGLCDFITSMDTDRICEWNVWYHLMNCGFALRGSGESDFPCMSSTRAGQGRTYVQLGKRTQIDYAAWCDGLARGRSYMSDGYAHALEFSVNGKTSGDTATLTAPARVKVTARVAFSSETPLESAYGAVIPTLGRRAIGDTVVMYPTRSVDPRYERGQRLVEIVRNGRAVASREVSADGREHVLEFEIPVERSSWVALREFPQLHTNPVNVIVAGKPIRASRDSARWALACVDQLWHSRQARIAPAEREEAVRAYDEARAIYRRLIAESASSALP